MGHKVKVYAHRGANDLAGLDRLHTAGFRLLQGNLLFARNEPVMVYPDGLSRRLPDGNLDYGLAEIQAIGAEQGIEVPTLWGMLSALADLRMAMMLEVEIPGTVQRIAGVLKSFPHQVVITSFLGDELADASSLRLETGVLTGHAPQRFVAQRMISVYSCTRFLMDHRYSPSGVVQALHEQHQDVIAFGVNTEAVAQAVARIGVDGILSDNPHHLARLPGFEPG